jgi:hypothetical protein
MKSIAAVALSEEFTQGSVTAAGILTGGIVLILGLTGFIDVINRIVPAPVVCGLQIGVGMRLAGKGLVMVQDLGWADSYDCILLAICCSILCLYWLREGEIIKRNQQNDVTRSKDTSSIDEEKGQISNGKVHVHSQENLEQHQSIKDQHHSGSIQRVLSCCLVPFRSSNIRQHPVGIYLFLLGVILAGVTLATTTSDQYELPLRFFGAPIAIWAIGDITTNDWKVGFLEGALPQLPLTTLNSVISVCALAHTLYPEKRREDCSPTCNDGVVGRKDVAISVGLMNLLLCPFGSMPNCHGAGGLAGQHRLGARHGSSVVFLGLAKVFLAVFFGASALTLLDAFPDAVLGVMLAIAGQELSTTGFALLVRSVEDKSCLDQEVNEEDARIKKSQLLRQSIVIAVITALVIITLGKTHYGALSGWVAHMVYGDGLSDLYLWRRERQKINNESDTDSV